MRNHHFISFYGVLSIHPSIYVSIYPSIYLSIYLSLHVYIFKKIIIWCILYIHPLNHKRSYMFFASKDRPWGLQVHHSLADGGGEHQGEELKSAVWIGWDGLEMFGHVWNQKRLKNMCDVWAIWPYANDGLFPSFGLFLMTSFEIRCFGQIFLR